MQYLKFTTRWIFILCLPVVFLSTSITWAANSSWLYNYGFKKYDVAETTGLTETELKTIASELIAYFNSGEKYITLTIIQDGKTVDLFTEREVIHLWEVKTLFRIVYYILGLTLAYIMIYGTIIYVSQRRMTWSFLSGAVFKGSILSLAFMATLALGVLVAFGPLFWWFHEIVFVFFEGDYWILDPARHYLIRLFPQNFWSDAFLLCGGITAGLALICGLSSGGYLWLKKR